MDHYSSMDSVMPWLKFQTGCMVIAHVLAGWRKRGLWRWRATAAGTSQGTESGLEDKASSVRRQKNRMLLCIELPGTFHLLAPLASPRLASKKGCGILANDYTQALFSSHSINPINTKKTVTSNVSTHAWSTKWSIFTELFAQMDCKSQDESNDAN